MSGSTEKESGGESPGTVSLGDLSRARLIALVKSRPDYALLGELFSPGGVPAEQGSLQRLVDLRSPGGLGRVPIGLTHETLEMYHEIARRQIAAGLDVRGTQAVRMQIIELLLASGRE